MKFCGRCGDWLPRDCFQRDAGNSDGLRTECKACRAERRAKLRGGAERRPVRGERRGMRYARANARFS